MKKDVLGIKIDDISNYQAVEKVKEWLSKNGKHYITTPNPEIVMMAQKDQDLKKIINHADLSVPDGIGLKLICDIVYNTPGVDLMEELIKTSADYGFTIGLLGGGKGVSEKADECLRKKYPGVRIVYADSGGIIDSSGEWIEGNRKALIPMDLLFVGFGPPKQEKWIYKNLEKIPVKVAIGVGGSLDYISGTVPRAPKWVRSLGFEWLFRLITQPWRIRRQLALANFLWKTILAKILR